jgi:hypothetical protein
MSPIARTAALTVLWIAAMLAAAVVLVVGLVTLSDAALRMAFAAIALVTLLASLLLFQAPQPADPIQESRRMATLRATAELYTSLR